MEKKLMITPEIDLLLACLKGDTREFIQLLDDFPVNWKHFTDLAVHHRIYPLVYEYIKTNGAGRVPASVRETLKMRAIEYNFKDDALIAVLKETVAALDKRGVRYCLLKGPVLGRMLYGDNALRPSNDIDILIGQNDMEAVIASLARLGFEVGKEYGELPEIDWEGVFRREQHIKVIRGGILIELHWRVMSSKYYVFKGLEAENLLRQAVQRECDGFAVYTLSPADELIYLMNHGAVHYWFRLRWLNDIARYLAKFPELDLDVVRQAFLENNMQNCFYQTMLLISGLFGEENARAAICAEDAGFGGRLLYRLTFPFIKSIKEMTEYPLLSLGYFRKMIYVFWLLPDNGSRLRFFRHQLRDRKGDA